jgi:hypothetical protein
MVTDPSRPVNSARRCTVTRTTHGWDVREEDGSRIVRHATYTDWHRVERALAIFNLQDRSARPATEP